MLDMAMSDFFGFDRFGHGVHRCSFRRMQNETDPVQIPAGNTLALGEPNFMFLSDHTNFVT